LAALDGEERRSRITSGVCVDAWENFSRGSSRNGDAGASCPADGAASGREERLMPADCDDEPGVAES